MLPPLPPIITTPDGAKVWYDRLSGAQHSTVSSGFCVRRCKPVTPVDWRHYCPICLSLLWDAVETPCGHVFCASCLVKALKLSPTCPLDRRPLPQPAGPPMSLSFPLNYPNDDSRTRRWREIWAFNACGAFSGLRGPSKLAMAELRVECPFRKSEGCKAKLPWDTWNLRTHITEMRHGEGKPKPTTHWFTKKNALRPARRNVQDRSTHDEQQQRQQQQQQQQLENETRQAVQEEEEVKKREGGASTVAEPDPNGFPSRKQHDFQQRPP